MEKLSLQQCCEIIVALAPIEPALNYAYPYAASFLDGSCAEDGDPSGKMQIPYLLNNIAHWRGTPAKVVRTALKRMESK